MFIGRVDRRARRSPAGRTETMKALTLLPVVASPLLATAHFIFLHVVLVCNVSTDVP